MGAGATRTKFGPDELGGPCFVADFPNLQNHKTLGKTGARESIDHSWGCSLRAARRAPGEVPTMCSDERLQVYGEMLWGPLFSLEEPVPLSHSNSFNPTMNSTGVRLYYYEQFYIMVPKSPLSRPTPI